MIDASQVALSNEPLRRQANAALRTLFMAIEQVMGPEGIRAVQNSGELKRFGGRYPPDNLEKRASHIAYAEAQQAIEDIYGQRGARGWMLRIGRATFRFALEEQSPSLALALKVLPEERRLKLMLNRVARGAAELLDTPAHVEETAAHFIYVVEDCPCRFRQRTLKTPCCYVTVGGLMEAMRWATGLAHDVTEYTCINCGDDACRYRVEKRPRT
jgi:predicted hydrocarbon binding protein